MSTSPGQLRARADTPLKRILTSEGRSQAWLAREVGARRQRMWAWVHGIDLPPQPTRERIARALGRQVDEIWPPTLP